MLERLFHLSAIRCLPRFSFEANGGGCHTESYGQLELRCCHLKPDFDEGHVMDGMLNIVYNFALESGGYGLCCRRGVGIISHL